MSDLLESAGDTVNADELRTAVASDILEYAYDKETAVSALATFHFAGHELDSDL